MNNKKRVKIIGDIVKSQNKPKVIENGKEVESIAKEAESTARVIVGEKGCCNNG